MEMEMKTSLEMKITLEMNQEMKTQHQPQLPLQPTSPLCNHHNHNHKYNNYLIKIITSTIIGGRILKAYS